MASLCVVLFIVVVHLFYAQNVFGFSFELYHSYNSSLYDPIMSETKIIRRAISRGVNKSNMVTLNAPVADLESRRLGYVMKIRLATPPVDIIALADTGSDLTWTQCQPCTKCMPQTMPLFNSTASSTYARIFCDPSHPCPPESKSQCHADGFCHHDIRYAGKAYSKGILSTETLRMRSTSPHHSVVEIPNYIFGCGTDNEGNFGGNVGSGIIGLGAGPQSLVSQLGPLRFSHCLIPHALKDRVSHIYFGQNAVVHGPGTIRVPLVNKQPVRHYFVTLEALTVGMMKIEFIGRSETIEEGNIVIDSGTTIMKFPRHVYTKIRRAVTMQTHAIPVSVPDPSPILDLCFEKETVQFPSIVAHFRGGDVPLEQYNIFLHVGGVKCLAIGVSAGLTVYGSLTQQNFMIGFDKISRTSVIRLSSPLIAPILIRLKTTNDQT